MESRDQNEITMSSKWHHIILLKRGNVQPIKHRQTEQYDVTFSGNFGPNRKIAKLHGQDGESRNGTLI